MGWNCVGSMKEWLSSVEDKACAAKTWTMMQPISRKTGKSQVASRR
jgi:hypothetical protein